METFSPKWQQAPRPTSSYGDTNSWDASDFIERMISGIAAEPGADATRTLQQLLSVAEPSYVQSLRDALAQQRKLRRDHEYVPATIAHLSSVASNALPGTIDDMRAYFGDRVATVQARMHASNTDMWEAYWNGAKPRNENHCRNRLVEHISGRLRATIVEADAASLVSAPPGTIVEEEILHWPEVILPPDWPLGSAIGSFRSPRARPTT